MITNLDYGNKLFGFYRGIVLKHLDHGKCKIFIFGVYHDTWQTKPDLIPNAEPATGIFGGNLNFNGTFSYPNINSMVWCFFANGDQNHPVYFSSIPGGQKSLKAFDSVMPNVHKFIAGRTEFKMDELGLIQMKSESQDIDTEVDIEEERQLRKAQRSKLIEIETSNLEENTSLASINESSNADLLVASGLLLSITAATAASMIKNNSSSSGNINNSNNSKDSEGFEDNSQSLDGLAEQKSEDYNEMSYDNTLNSEVSLSSNLSNTEIVKIKKSLLHKQTDSNLLDEDIELETTEELLNDSNTNIESSNNVTGIAIFNEEAHKLLRGISVENENENNEVIEYEEIVTPIDNTENEEINTNIITNEKAFELLRNNKTVNDIIDKQEITSNNIEQVKTEIINALTNEDALEILKSFISNILTVKTDPINVNSNNYTQYREVVESNNNQNITNQTAQIINSSAVNPAVLARAQTIAEAEETPSISNDPVTSNATVTLEEANSLAKENGMLVSLDDKDLELYGNETGVQNKHFWKLVTFFKTKFIEPYKAGNPNSIITQGRIFTKEYMNLILTDVLKLIEKLDKRQSIAGAPNFNAVSYIQQKITQKDPEWLEYDFTLGAEAYLGYKYVLNEFNQYLALRFVLTELLQYLAGNNAAEMQFPANKTGITGKVEVNIQQENGVVTKEEILHEIINHSKKSYAKILLQSMFSGSGFIKIDTNGKIILNASDILVLCNKFEVKAKTSAEMYGNKVNINGNSGDCILSKVSLCTHDHHDGWFCKTSPPTTDYWGPVISGFLSGKLAF